MRAESNIKPKNKLEIENIINGKCEIIFFDKIQELEPLEDNEERYSYDTYRLKTNYRDELEQELNENKEKYEQWLELAKKIEYNELASEIRAKRNQLLQESDKYMCIDRLNFNFPENLSMTNIISSLKDFFDGFANISKSNIAKYRQKLRDITKQPGFPYEVKFPEKPIDE